jgi:hypothetical protein
MPFDPPSGREQHHEVKPLARAGIQCPFATMVSTIDATGRSRP